MPRFAARWCPNPSLRSPPPAQCRSSSSATTTTEATQKALGLAAPARVRAGPRHLPPLRRAHALARGRHGARCDRPPPRQARSRTSTSTDQASSDRAAPPRVPQGLSDADPSLRRVRDVLVAELHPTGPIGNAGSRVATGCAALTQLEASQTSERRPTGSVGARLRSDRWTPAIGFSRMTFPTRSLMRLP